MNDYKNPKYILLLLLLLGGGLRLYNISEHGLAGDEKYGLLVSQFVGQEGSNQQESLRKPHSPYFTPKEFWAEKDLHDFQWAIAHRDNGSGAAYALTVHYFTKIFGISDTSLRLPSLIFNLLTILLIFIFVKTHLKSEKLALLSAFLATVSPFYINFSQVARTYSMLYFFALLSTHLFLLIIENEEKYKKTALLYLYYGLSAFICLMCHFSIFPLFLIHGLYVLLYFRKLRGWIGLILAMLIPVAGTFFWLNSDGGKWLFHSLDQSAKVYNEMARSHPNDELSLANPINIFRQLRHVISSMFLLIDGFPLLFFSMKKTYLLGLVVFVISLYFSFKTTLSIKNSNEKHIRFFIVLLSFIPLISLIVFAYQDGNTFRIMPRYVGYSYSFNLILISLIIKDLYQEIPLTRYPILMVFGLQICIISTFIFKIYQDNPPNYFQVFAEPRTKNPYKYAAEKLIKIYAKGDTILHPSYQDNSMAGGYDMPKYSVQDAQYLNFYLPKNSEIIQRIEPNEPNKIILKKANGEEILIFDFEGTKYRY